MDALMVIIEGIPSALIATVITVFAVRFVRPRLDLAQQVAIRWSSETDTLRCGFKMVNGSRRAIVDVRFELAIVYRTADGQEVIKLVTRDRPEPMSISGRGASPDSGVYIVKYPEQLLEDLIDREIPAAGRCSLRLRVFARDAFSGQGKQFERIYRDPFEGTMVYGSFEAGRSFAVRAADPHPRWEACLSRLAATGGRCVGSGIESGGAGLAGSQRS